LSIMCAHSVFLCLAVLAAARAQDLCSSSLEDCQESDASALLQHSGRNQQHKLQAFEVASKTPRDLVERGILHNCSHTCSEGTYDFLCPADFECCGPQCIPVGAQCCTNDYNVHFQCDAFSTCCGNTCAGPGSKCCSNVHGDKYPVAMDTPCEDELCKTCHNSQGTEFVCGINSTCCGDICVGEHDVCCFNENNNSFACGEGSTCCGNVCAAPGTYCCNQDGNSWPVLDASHCDPLPLPPLPCARDAALIQESEGHAAFPRAVVEYLEEQGVVQICHHEHLNITCAADQVCCGLTCMPADSVCCENDLNFKFQCGAGSTCCGNACAAPGSKCCTNAQNYQYPVLEGTDCLTEHTITCNTGTLNQTFYCGGNSTCCGDVCVGAGGACCANEYNNFFACGAGSSCCGNACMAPGSKCCDIDGVRFPVTEDTVCPPVTMRFD